jgi:hypothetical protein
MRKVFRSAAAVLASLGALTLVPATAQAADYQVYKQTLPGDPECQPNSQCNDNFARVSQGQVLRIDHLSCYLSHKEGVSVGVLQLVVQGPAASGNKALFVVTPNLVLQSKVNVDGVTYFNWVSNDTIRAVAKAGQRFQVYAQVRKGTNGSLGTVENLACGISGTVN